MKVIYKYPLDIRHHQEIEMPSGSEILTVQSQGEMGCLWAMIDTEKEIKEMRIISVVGTGHEVPPDCVKYIGTFQMAGGALIWHVFETSPHKETNNE